MEAKVDRLETNQIRLETRIENEVIDKIRIRRSIETNARIREHDREIRLLRIEKQS